MDEFNGPYIKAPCRLGSDEQIRVAVNFTADDRFLLVSA
ncbi:Uncharacterised protein [Mycobacteroides abscessus subsp. abscessus]|nr:Uncharacterised protein [Mycobacteroides abscessus subsp. abscessus]